MKTNIVLIGFLNTGKTLIGKTLAGRLEREFLDIDEIITGRTGKTPGEIVASEGEIAFRDLEIEAVKSVADVENAVISCGGGAIVNRINIDRLKLRGKVILLHAPLETIRERTRRHLDRPILRSGQPDRELERLWEERSCLWGPAAGIVIDTTGKPLDEIVDEIIAAALPQGNSG